MSHGDVVNLIKESGLHVRLTIGVPLKEGGPSPGGSSAGVASNTPMQASPSLLKAQLAHQQQLPQQQQQQHLQQAQQQMQHSPSWRNGALLDASEDADQCELTEVTLERQALGFGFRIVGGTEEGSQVTVGHIVPGGAADQDQRISTGDEILSIDGINVVSAPCPPPVNPSITNPPF